MIHVNMTNNMVPFYLMKAIFLNLLKTRMDYPESAIMVSSDYLGW